MELEISELWCLKLIGSQEIDVTQETGLIDTAHKKGKEIRH